MTLTLQIRTQFEVLPAFVEEGCLMENGKERELILYNTLKTVPCTFILVSHLKSYYTDTDL